MIERNFVNQRTKEFFIKNRVESILKGAEISEIKLKKIPLGEKILIKTSRPSLVVGSKGSNIRAITATLKKEYNLENPRVEIVEVTNPYLDANSVASRIVNSLERFGSSRFKGVGHKNMANVLRAGAIGVEIKISGKIPGSRAKSWRFYQGYLKKCGDISTTGVKTAYASALLKTGIIGVQVRIMPPDLILPDHVEILPEETLVVEESDLEEVATETKVSSKKGSPSKKKALKKKSVKEKVSQKEASNNEEVLETVKEVKKEKVIDVKKKVVDTKESAIEDKGKVDKTIAPEKKSNKSLVGNKEGAEKSD